MNCDVLLLNQDSNYDQILTYRIPEGREEFRVGLLVSVPVRNHRQKGLILRFNPQSPDVKQLKDMEAVLSPFPVITEQGIALAFWLSNYYTCSLNKAIHLFLIPQIRQREKKIIKPGPNFTQAGLLLGQEEKKILDLLHQNPQGLTLAQVRKALGTAGEQALDYLAKDGYLTIEKTFATRVQEKQHLVVSLTAECPSAKQVKRAPRQKEIIEYLHTHGRMAQAELKKQLGPIDSALASMKKKGWIRVTTEQDYRDPFQVRLKGSRPVELNQEQQAAAAEICAGIRRGEANKWLLYGVTGSGKTEVYLQAIAEALKIGKQVLYLVPEIALTPQITAVLLEAFGEQVAILHSSLSPGERYDEWLRIRNGQARVIVGPRSAVFAPFSNLGLIIVDEEHENTYKQSEPDPRYDARTVVLELARIFQAAVVMGSATPSLNRQLWVREGRFRMLRLTERVAARPMPKITIVDMKQEIRQGNTGIFSSNLKAALERVLANGEQALLFINRRGFHTFVLCRECGTALTCPHCAITLTYHQARNRLVCHYCNYTRELPRQCPACGSGFIRYLGTGTERVAQEAAKLFPSARILRMDTDTTRIKGSHTSILKDFQEGKGQILVGTQMIAKGLDFPAVTLVGIVNPDILLNMPDFQAGERAFQLLAQVAGRAGRGELPGEVIVQTYNPDNYLFPSFVENDYDAFSATEMANRSLLQYPPFTTLARVVVSGVKEENVRERVEYLAKLLKIEIVRKKVEIELLGPGPAPLSYIKGRHRYHLIMKCKQIEPLQRIAQFLREQMRSLTPEPRVIIDMEAQNLL